ncbi:amidohydrolase [Paracrocinitomix mangrovi]|uniref:amidohydrolase n=1 Tax=Paracrocinitomix mangrovi TaxID=2862509 RepID=UPI001C8F075C|nr:amidohydrolase [Paracrocinitomix mangrovi]UKN00753.1 amidohydrolase [Paracrocinitomix mangrovi]
MQDLKIAMVQTQQFWEDKEKNLQHFEKHFVQIPVGGADLLLLPEMFNTGFTMNASNMAEDIDGTSIKWLQKWAKELQMQIGASLIIRENDNYYNRFVIVSENGIETSYNKRHLFRMADEQLHFSPGTERVIYELKGWKILLQVCYDLRFPVYSRNKTIGDNKEYDAVIYIANWPERRNNVWKTLLQARAIENQVYCIGVNRVGIDGNDISYTGDSMFIDPWGNVEAKFSENTEIVKILTMDYHKINDITNRFPAFKDADSWSLT